VNCHCQLEKHPVGDVEPVKFVVQYLTQAAVKLGIKTEAAYGMDKCNTGKRYTAFSVNTKGRSRISLSCILVYPFVSLAAKRFDAAGLEGKIERSSN